MAGCRFGPGAKPILKGERDADDRRPAAAPSAPRRRRDEGPADPLFEALRAARRELAAEAGVPPYVMFHNSHACARSPRASPRSLAELARVERRWRGQAGALW